MITRCQPVARSPRQVLGRDSDLNARRCAFAPVVLMALPSGSEAIRACVIKSNRCRAHAGRHSLYHQEAALIRCASSLRTACGRSSPAPCGMTHNFVWALVINPAPADWCDIQIFRDHSASFSANASTLYAVHWLSAGQCWSNAWDDQPRCMRCVCSDPLSATSRGIQPRVKRSRRSAWLPPRHSA